MTERFEAWDKKSEAQYFQSGANAQLCVEGYYEGDRFFISIIDEDFEGKNEKVKLWLKQFTEFFDLKFEKAQDLEYPEYCFYETEFTVADNQREFLREMFFKANVESCFDDWQEMFANYDDFKKALVNTYF
ncbi:MAG: hypothetical protein IJS60_08810 [Abditibacteriota bacterium]|nr:hypothetical protein [Abditibacteriota bacterium]